jgi:adenylate cyclase
VTEPVALESILSCFRGVIPSAFATCSPDGVPNVAYLSIVHYLDTDRIALSRQFFNKTRANLDVNPASQVRVVDPETLDEYELDLEYLHTESDGPAFEAMRADLDAIASQTGASGIFRLRGLDVHRVLRCAQVGEPAMPTPRRAEREILQPLDEFTRRLAACADYETATRVALEALDDLFDFSPAILLVRDPRAERLFTVASHGYPRSGAGAEVAVGAGVIGTAAASAQVVTVTNLARSRIMHAAARSQVGDTAEAAGREIPLPGLDDTVSVAAVPLEAGGDVTGVLYLESDRVGHFGPHNQRLLRIIGRHLATALRGLADAEPRPTEPATVRAAPEASTGAARGSARRDLLPGGRQRLRRTTPTSSRARPDASCGSC